MTEMQHNKSVAAGMQGDANKVDRALRDWQGRLQTDINGMLQRLTDLVHQESPTNDARAVSQAISTVAGWAVEGGGTVRLHQRREGLEEDSKTDGDPVEQVPHILEARFGDPADLRKPVLLLGHLDTVWPVGTLAKMPWHIADGWAYGPGVLDMKAGVVMALAAIELVTKMDAVRPVILMLSSDEETGSHRSRKQIEEVATGCGAIFVLEPAQGTQGAYKTARKGVGQFRLEIRGVPSHSGVDFGAGHSAVRELAWQIEQISALTELDRGVTLNVGVVGGGTQSNVVAAEAWAEIDLRVPTVADAEAVEARLRALQPRDPKCELRLTGALNRPPMERTEGTARLYEQARRFAEALGFKLEEAATGGGSDGNFTSALGVPTLDGMGAVGNGAHAKNESIRIDSLVSRTALLAAMIASTV